MPPATSKVAGGFFLAIQHNGLPAIHYQQEPGCFAALQYAFLTKHPFEMMNHQDVLANGFTGRRQLAVLIITKQVSLAGNRALKIYGTLQCASGKRMKTENRVFFADEAEAVTRGYRPCGHCMRSEYLLWKENK